jgi:hypothetical protein
VDVGQANLLARMTIRPLPVVDGLAVDVSQPNLLVRLAVRPLP